MYLIHINILKANISLFFHNHLILKNSCSYLGVLIANNVSINGVMGISIFWLEGHIHAQILPPFI